MPRRASPYRRTGCSLTQPAPSPTACVYSFCRVGGLLHNLNLLLRQPIQLVHQPVDLPVGGVDLALEDGFLVCRVRLQSNRSITLGTGASTMIESRPRPYWVFRPCD